ncbi:MAG: hypothetical protein ABSA16_16780 [Thermoguttaceae bacterium]
MSLHASSQFRGSVQRNNRRRRLLTEDTYNGGAMPISPVSSGDAPQANQSDHYRDAFFMDEQMRLIDLVPRRLTILALWLAAGLAVIAGLGGLHAWQSGLSTRIQGWQFAALDLTQRGCLGNWFSSLLLLAASTIAVLTYTIRRHRTDDYHGRYRIWLWAALCYFLSAADVAANLHEGLKQIMIYLTKTSIWGDGTLWWIIPYVLVFGVLGSRLVLDMRPCRLGIATFSLAAAGYLVAAGMELGLATIGDAFQAVMIRSAAAMFGHLMLLMSMALNARFVILDAEGLLPCRKSKKHADLDKGAAEKSLVTPGNGWMRTDAPTGTPQPVLRRASSPAASSPSTTQPIFSKSPAPPAPVTRKLTKQEKKALRERLLRERLERQRR